MIILQFTESKWHEAINSMQSLRRAVEECHATDSDAELEANQNISKFAQEIQAIDDIIFTNVNSGVPVYMIIWMLYLKN